MKAVVVTEDGPALRDVPVPSPSSSDVLIRVRAAGMNRADLGMAAGHAHGARGGVGTVLGMEFAGEVEAVGEAVTAFSPGDRVMASGAGGYAEHALADQGRVSRLPDNNIGFTTAATLPVALQTMHDAVVTNGRLQRGEAVLIQGASSGVGLMGMQIAKEMGARLVVGTSTDPERRARLTEFGADLAVDTADPAWPDAVLDATGGEGVQLVVDQVSGHVMNANLRATAILGRIVNVGRLGGQTAPFDFDLHALRRISYVGVTFRTRSAEEVRDIVRRMREDLWGALEAGRLRLPLAAEFPLAEAAAALAHMRANRHFGKIVLVP